MKQEQYFSPDAMMGGVALAAHPSVWQTWAAALCSAQRHALHRPTASPSGCLEALAFPQHHYSTHCCPDYPHSLLVRCAPCSRRSPPAPSKRCVPYVPSPDSTAKKRERSRRKCRRKNSLLQQLCSQATQDMHTCSRVAASIPFASSSNIIPLRYSPSSDRSSSSAVFLLLGTAT